MLLLKGTTMTQHLGQPAFQGPAWSFGSSKTAVSVHLFCRVGSCGLGRIWMETVIFPLERFQANRGKEANVQIPGQNVMCVAGEIQRSYNVQRVEEIY